MLFGTFSISSLVVLTRGMQIKKLMCGLDQKPCTINSKFFFNPPGGDGSFF